MMNDLRDDLLTIMNDIGCLKEDVEKADNLIKKDNLKELILHLKRCRIDLLDKMHESQKRVDDMDYIIYQLKLDLKNKERKIKI